MKYPIHANNDFKKKLRNHKSLEVINCESQSNIGLDNIINYCKEKYNKFNKVVIMKVDVNIYQRLLKIFYLMEKEEDLSFLILIFPNWHILEYLIKMTFKN